MEEMVMLFKLREPKIGMKVASKKATCCFGMPKNDVGVIKRIEPNGLEFTVNDWKNQENSGCVQCCMELRPVTKAQWLEMCDKEDAKLKRGKQ